MVDLRARLFPCCNMLHSHIRRFFFFTHLTMRLRVLGRFMAISLLGVCNASVPHLNSTLPANHTAVEQYESEGFVRDIWDKLKTTASCAACQDILVPVKALAFVGDGPFIKVLQSLCKLVKNSEMCDGSFALEGPIIADVFRKMKIGSRASQSFCATFLGLCEYPDVVPWTVPFPSTKPARGRPKPSGGKKPLRVVHYSDIHIDPLYVPGSSTKCDKLICCRSDDQSRENRSPAGPYGDHNCDTPISLEESMFNAIKELVPDAAFAIFTGDVVDHAIWNTSRPYVENSIEQAYGTMNHTLKMVYGTAGNHEMHPANAFQPGSQSTWAYKILAENWSQWIDEAAARNAARIGAYSTKFLGGNLRIISLNTNLYDRHNFWMYENIDVKDPNLQIEWLVKELEDAERAGENVYIIGHLPIGFKDALQDWSNYLDQVFKRYSSTIAAMFFGHTHVDHFEISYTDYSSRSASNAFMTSYIAPSLTPTSGMPSFRVYDVDPDTFGVLDATTYIADMADASFQQGPTWSKLYSAKEAYGKAITPPVTDPSAVLTPAFWHNVTESFRLDSGLFRQYMSRKSRGWQEGSCDDDCKSLELCQLRSARSQDNCVKPKFGFHLKKRIASEDHGEHDECGVPLFAEIFHTLSESEKTLVAFLDMIRKAQVETETP
ncbi:Sphingomyelin phosphodiesterase [Purpureocillium takamizusanense]|uniref:Sphingomyelin phosphodiesterase n=1 Tax=Purpureocillium takamizusanense TaxID=2060973 RepID=A0A9Q8V9D0_9HYPO|nr:Sphingomyelin phosphodiesterase [Purpureocillium takamizusanense]UNI16667.1 Sphingomyelin phosphodiesterase [Purpureocillium takamizusanense]